jgi:hypothetical protein
LKTFFCGKKINGKLLEKSIASSQKLHKRLLHFSKVHFLGNQTLNRQILSDVFENVAKAAKLKGKYDLAIRSAELKPTGDF